MIRVSTALLALGLTFVLWPLWPWDGTVLTWQKLTAAPAQSVGIGMIAIGLLGLVGWLSTRGNPPQNREERPRTKWGRSD